MEAWYKKRFRRTLLDMHIEDWEPSFLSRYNPEEYFRQLKKAEITAPMIYVQSHVGLCYWPTKTGVMHKAFVGKEDQVKRLFELCRKDGMDTVLYYSIIFNNREYEKHPDWRMKDASGRDSRENGGRYGLCCPNNEEYRAFIKEQIKEFCEYFEFEGVFFDMTFWPEVCYCDSCKARWEKEVGGKMPETVDWKDEKWQSFDKKRHEWMGEFAQLLTAEVKKYRPDATIEHQYGNSIAYWRFGNNENVSLASDYIGTDLYGGIKQQSFACKAWYHLTQNQPFQYMTSRCTPSLAEHTSTKSEDQLLQCVAMTYLHHGASLLIDAIDPIGTVDSRVYDLFGKIYGKMKDYEKYLSRGTMAYDVSLYFNLNGKMNAEANGIGVMDHKLDIDAKEAGTVPHIDALMGAAQSLASHHIPYGIINNWKPEEMENHKILVLPDVPNMSHEEIELIKKYIYQGGRIYFSGHSAPGLLEAIFGLKWNGYTDERITYMAPSQNQTIMEGYFTEEYPLVMFEKAVKAEGEIKGEVLASLTLPYTQPGIHWSMFPTDIKPEEYVDVNGPAYPFSTIHANPPGIKTSYPALLKSDYGAGKAVWSALPIEKADRYQHSDIFSQIIRMLSDDEFQFEAQGPESVECVMFEAKEEGQKLIGLIETRQGFHIPPTYDVDLWIKCEKEPRSVFMLPEEKEIPYSYFDNKLSIHLDKFEIFCMLAVQF